MTLDLVSASHELPRGLTRQASVDEREPSLGALAKDLLLPRSRAAYVFPLIALWFGLDYWIGTFRHEPHLPLAARILYLSEGDTEYIALACTLARGVFGEASSLESFGTGAQSFPFGSVALHAACVALFGLPGFIVAHALAALAYYSVLALFLRVLGLSSRFSRAASVLTTVGVSASAWHELLQLVQFLSGAELALWGQRLPRPLITEPLSLFNLTLSMALVFNRSTRQSRGFWIVMGVATAVMIQGDIYSAAILLPLHGLAVAIVCITSRFDRRILKHCAYLVAATALALAPFVWQQLSTLPDVSRRLGLFAVDRSNPPNLTWDWRGRLCLVLAALCTASLLGRARLGLGVRPSRFGPLGWLALAAFSAWLAMPLFCLLTGKGVQLYHFELCWQELTSYVLLGAALVGASHTFRLLGYPLTSTGPQVALNRAKQRTGIVLVAMLSAHSILQSGHLLYRGNPRPAFASNANYKSDFVALQQVLAGERYAKRRVLATFDHTLYVWWTAFEGRFAFVSDPFLSTRSDAELEARFMAFCHALGVPPPRFEQMLRDSSYQVLWLSHNKYNLSAVQSFAPLSAYPEAARPAPDAVLVGWNIVPPAFEIERMMRQYRERTSDAFAFTPPDIIITTAQQAAENLAPSPTRYTRDYANGTFQVWLRL